MQMPIRCALLGALVLAPAAASAQGLFTLGPAAEDPLVIQEPVVVEQPPVVVEEAAVVVEEAPVVVEEPRVMRAPAVVAAPPMSGGPIGEDDARMIAMASGIVEVEDVHRRLFDGDYEVDGTDASGGDLEVRIDADTGAVLEIDD